ncbi:DNA-binding transcriptional regulator YbjK [Thermocatellispora tengchongensis]|uniref:DNA-binding transcriptional regulator YbjK n=1 Tax=Thermocatellispora tengchongensis TaxID=1073253 RepID=A0A840P5I5_9ACTN|nr:TetR/AcrR family transcriptional regulator [Thermocatellispora tengchongensis]MBB5136574.1 DNA-binding transcriptional regulator YbjK [Thermocatellispora tengchongensis]
MISPRATLIADTAITLLAERGMRGLTHRAVDEAAGLPAGSTSNLARTRAALLETTLARLTELEEAAYALTLVPAQETEGADPIRVMADMIGRLLHTQLTDGRVRTLARYELALEANRRPELRVIYDRAGARFRGPAEHMLAAAGSPDPVRHGRQLVAYAEGLIFDAIAGAGATPTQAELQAGLRDLLDGMLRGGGAAR